MKSNRFKLALVWVTLAATLVSGAETPTQRDARMGWWREARFGLFIHWDMSSIAGTEISWSRKAPRPLDIGDAPAGYVADPVYDQLYRQFNPQRFNAAEWVGLAKKAGMKYVVFTAKHHGGFCLWDTRFTDYSIMHTPFKRDVVKELSEACHAAGLRFGLYYSQRDWHHPDYGIGDNAKYQQYLKAQLTELLTQYGKVDVMWFDSFGKGDSLQYWHADEILALVKQLQPEILVNDRSGYFGQKVESLAGDFDTPEQRLGEFQNTRAWESCMCLVNAPDGGWSYRPDGQVKSFSDCLHTLLGCATGDGNLLLDVGPDATGVIPADQARRLVEMGEWLAKYGESIYGTRGGPWKPTKAIASTRQGNTIYLHVYKWDGDHVTLPDIPRKVTAARLLAGGPAQVRQAEGELVVRVPQSAHEPLDTVIRLELDGSAMDLPVLTIAALPARSGKTILNTFDYDGVTLDGGRLRQQVEEVRAYYLRVPNDDLLKPYRQRAGKPAPGADLKGVYIGHGIFGQFLSGLARLYAATGDPACKGKAQALMEGWAECIEPDGYALQAKPIDLAPYHFEKLVGGLVDMIVYGGDPRAATHLGRIIGWAETNVAGVEQQINTTNANWYVRNGEWYTLSENLYRAFQATGDPRCRRLAERFEYTDFWNLIAKRANVFDRPGWGGWYHAYSHVNSFCGAGPAYLVKGDEHYLDVLKAAFDFIQEQEAYATGGFGPNETLMPRAALPGTLTSTGNHFETQCGSWAGFKLTKYLMTCTGNARYGDWTERLLLNGVGASIPMDAEGRVFYYSDYNLGGAAKRLIPDGWPCCSGTRVELTADYQDLIYLHDEDSLYVAQFAPATVAWRCQGERVVVTQRTRFPEEEATELTVAVARPQEFGLAVRVPSWLAKTLTASVNDKPVAVKLGTDNWARIHRKWSNGDRLRIELPMAFHLSRIDPKNEYPAAIMRGPVVLAVRSADGNPSRQIEYGRLNETLKPVPGQPLNYRTGKDEALLVRPFYQFAAGEPYFMYLDPVQNFTRRSWEGYRFSAGWTDFNQWQTASSPGASVEHTFEGTGVRIHGFHYDDGARGQVEIDGKVVGVLDEYGPNRGEPAQWDFTGLSPGTHNLKVIVLAESNPKSKGRFLNLAWIEALSGGP